MKVCTKCLIEKPFSEFYTSRGNGARCKKCVKEINDAWMHANPERFRAHGTAYFQRNREARIAKLKEYDATHPQANRERKLRALYGIDSQTFDALYEGQQGQCAICGAWDKLSVDHDHTTSCVRGLLCANCNKGLGLLKDDPEIIQAAIDYLVAHDS